MKKILSLLAIAASLVFVSCDDTTNELGGSLIGNTDKLTVSTDTFDVSSKTILAGAVTARSSVGHLGKMVDSETNTPVLANYMTQFNVLDNYQMSVADSIASRNASNEIIADSCEIRLFYKTVYGDSLAQMKLVVHELDHPVEEGTTYTSNFDPLAQGYARTSNGLEVHKSFTFKDTTSYATIVQSGGYKSLIVKLNGEYTDKQGKVYNNYGTYLMRKYQADPTAFRNPYRFLHEICPGFYFKIEDGEGAMAKIEQAQISVFYRTKKGTGEANTYTKFAGTEEVLQLTNYGDNTSILTALAAEQGHTYLQTPAGLFTELTLPVSAILAQHESDVINSAKIEVKRVNNNTSSTYNFGIPQNVLMIPAAEKNTFIANNKLNDNKTSFLAIYDSSSNSYVFNNIAGLINYFKQTQTTADSNWGKVLIIPVDLTTAKRTQNGKEVTVVTKISNYMGLSTTKLLGTSNGSNGLKISVVYSKFNAN